MCHTEGISLCSSQDAGDDLRYQDRIRTQLWRAKAPKGQSRYAGESLRLETEREAFGFRALFYCIARGVL
jgi:hypothetical protein